LGQGLASLPCDVSCPVHGIPIWGLVTLFLEEPAIKILIFIGSQTTLNKEVMWTTF
jgi:hypothetical protein